MHARPSNLQELFLAPYFCDVQEQQYFKLAMPFSTDPKVNFLIPRYGYGYTPKMFARVCVRLVHQWRT